MTVLQITRQCLGFSRYQLSLKAGVSIATISRIERGYRIKPMQKCERNAIATALNVDEDILFDEANLPKEVENTTKLLENINKLFLTKDTQQKEGTSYGL